MTNCGRACTENAAKKHPEDFSTTSGKRWNVVELFRHGLYGRKRRRFRCGFSAQPLPPPLLQWSCILAAGSADSPPCRRRLQEWKAAGRRTYRCAPWHIRMLTGLPPPVLQGCLLPWTVACRTAEDGTGCLPVCRTEGRKGRRSMVRVTFMQCKKSRKPRPARTIAGLSFIRKKKNHSVWTVLSRENGIPEHGRRQGEVVVPGTAATVGERSVLWAKSVRRVSV